MRKRPLARYVLPEIVDPEDTVCIQVSVPNDRNHIAAFMGQIYALASASQWQNDTSHTALEVAKVWWRVFNNLKHCDFVFGDTGVDEGIEQLIRQNPTNPCLLETSINGTDWCVFADLSKCVPSGNQPGSGSPLPPAGGGNACYHAQFNASGKWLLPYQVSTGDTITITNAKGASNDGSGAWFCPNGQTFFLSACTGATSLNGADPAPTIPHARIIAHIGSVYYDAYNTTITVPSGISFANVEFQINDASLSDNYGDLTFDVCATNNAAATFTHVFDFAVTDGLFVPDATIGSGNGVYAAGLYWNSNCVAVAGNYYTGACIKRTFASRTITSISVDYDAAVGTGNAQGFALYTNSTLQKNDSPPVFGTGKTQSWAGTASGITSISVTYNTDAWNNNTRCNTGYVHIKKVTVSGLGTDPF